MQHVGVMSSWDESVVQLSMTACCMRVWACDLVLLHDSVN